MTPSDRFYVYYSIDGGAFTAILNNFLPSQLSPSGDTLSYNWTVPDFGNNLDSEVRIRVLNNTRQVSDTSKVFRIYYEPIIEIISPSPGEFLLPGSSKAITWINGDLTSSDHFFFYYSVDGGGFSNFSNARHSQLSNSGDTSTFNWTLPNIESTNVKIRILNNSRAISDTTYSFSICTTCPAVALYTPNGGEVLAIGSQVEVGWNTGDAWVGTDNVKVEYSLNGGATFESTAIFDGTYAEITDNKILWTVPDVETTTGIVRVSNITQGLNDVSNASFTITTPPAIPTELTAISTVSSGTVVLSWTDNATNETNYNVQYSTNNVTWQAWANNLGVDANTYTASSVSNAGYWWRVTVVSSAFTTFSDAVFAGNYSNASRAISLDGTDDAVVLKDSTAFDFETGDFTIEAWINPNDLSSDHAIVSDYNNTPSNSMTFFTNANGGLSAYIGANATDLSSEDSILSTNKWDHVALTRAADSAFLYLNGNRVAHIAGLSARSLSSSFNMTIGKQPSGAAYSFNGQIDEVRIWNTAVSDADLLTNYFTQLNGDETGLLAYYQMNHTAGSAIADKTSNKHSADWVGSSSGVTTPSWVSSQALVDNLPPAVPTDLVILPNQTGGIDFTWTDNAINETQYSIQYSTDKNSWFAWTNNLGVNINSFSIASLNNIGYWWRVVVTNGVFTNYSEELFKGNFTNAGRAISLDGADAITIRDSTAFDFGTGDFTIEAWINTNDLSAIHTIISDFNNTSAGSMRLLTTANGELAASVGSETFDVISPEGVLEINKWDHVALTRAADSAFLHLNGKRVAATGGMAARALTSEANMTIGKQASGTEFYFNGQIDDVRIWNVARSSEEISTNYFTPLNGDETGLVAYYPLNHQAGTIVDDQSTNDYKADWAGSGAPSWVNSQALVNNEPPLPPTDFVGVVGQNASTIEFTWTDNATNETWYSVEYSTDKVNWTAWTLNLGADVTTYTTSNFSNAGYWFRIRVSTGVIDAYSEEIFRGTFTNASRALSLDGTDDEVVISDSTAFDFGTGDFTMEAWINSNDLSNTHTIISDRNGSATGSMGLYTTQGGGLAAIIGSEVFDVEASDKMVANKWYHTAVVRKADSAFLFLNGRRIASNTGLSARALNSEVNLTIGKQPSGTPLYFNGQIDEVRIWSTARSDTAMQANYLSLLKGDETGLEAYYQMNHQAGVSISDQSVNNREALWTGPAGGFNTSRWVASQALIDNTPFVDISLPTAEVFWEVGTNQIVQWTRTNFLTNDNIEIRLSADGGLTSGVLSQGISNNYNWSGTISRFSLTVPDSISTEARIIVVNTTQNVSDTTEIFEIGTVNRSISILTPNGGETLIQGETTPIKFEVEGLLATDFVAIQLSLDSGASFFSTIANARLSQYPDSTYNWNTNAAVSDRAMLRVVVSSYGLADTTDAVFSVIEAPTAPVYSNLSANIIGDDFEFSYRMSEPGTGYMVILPNGSTTPTGEQIKAAALGESAIEGQLAFASYDYSDIEQTATQSGSAGFMRQSVYDIYLSAEDAEGELNPGQTIQNVFANFTPFEQDSIDVNRIYQLMNGESWLNTAERWDTLAIAARPEITVAQDRIVGLDLSEKGLTGGFTTVITLLDSLQTLDLSNNSLEAIPNMNQMAALTSLNVANNRLTFSDLLLNVNIYTTSDQYSPQAELLARDSLALPKGSTYSFSLSLFGQGNVYSWNVDYYKTYERSFEELTEIQYSNLRLTNLDFENMGTYYLEVTNPALPDLTLSTGRIQVWATATLTIDIKGENDLPLAAGAAYALRNRGPGLPYDSIPKINGLQNPAGLQFTNGKAVFQNLLLGEYLIAIRADPTKYLPTYYTNTYLWEEADKLDFKDNLSQQMSMTLVPRELTEADGQGNITGGIEADFGEDSEEGGRVNARRKVKKAGCSMRRFVISGRTNEDVYELIAYVESDDEGRFNFDFLPEGTYRFNIEFPGIPMDPESFVEFVIGEGGANKFVLEATITEDGIAVERIITLGYSDLEADQFKVFPNPTTDRLFLSFPSENELNVQIISVSGQVVLEKQTQFMDTQIEFETVNLEEGVYFMQVLDRNDSSRKITYKVIVRH